MFHVEHLLSATYASAERVNKRLELLLNALFDVFSAIAILSQYDVSMQALTSEIASP